MVGPVDPSPVRPESVEGRRGAQLRTGTGVQAPLLLKQETVEESDSHFYEDNDHRPNQTFSETAKPEKENADEVHREPVTSVSPQRKGWIVWPSGYRWVWLLAAVVAVVGSGTWATWKLFLKPASVKRASTGKMAFSLPDKPSIAVLPFVNMSKDPEQEFFSDGLTEEIITTLSRSPNLLVTARTSTFSYKGRQVRVDQVAEELRVRFVLEGSVRRASKQIRISAQLIDATTGHHLWAERYDGTMKDVFAIQDEIASKIMKTLQVKLGAGPYPREIRGGSKNPEAYLKSVEANEQLLRSIRPGIARAQQLFEEVIALEPDFSRGYSGLALSYGLGRRAGMSKSPMESLARAIDLAKKALSLNEADAINHAALAYLLALTGQHDKAVVRAERALALNANSFSVLNFSGLAFMYSCRGKEAIAVLEKAEQLNPSFPFSSLNLSWAYRFAGQYEEAFKQAQKAVKRNPQSLLSQLALAATSNLSGREEEARTAAKEVLKLSPNFSLEWLRNDIAWKDKSQIDLTINALHKAGLK